VFLILAAVTLVAAVAAVTARNPVYCAIWFGVVLLGTAGLFLFQGAQFLGVATVVVYAGAILVTFLFVLMLAQPEGHAFYDRISWEAFLSAATAGVMICMLTNQIMLATGGSSPSADDQSAEVALESARQVELGENILAQQHVAVLGRQMFSEYLIAVEVAGALLLAALVGAVAIVAQGKQTPTVEWEKASGRSGSDAW
jgi:NADH-quinone oxidoreductase subunit J